MPSGVYERTRKVRADKKIRVNSGLSQDDHDKLVQLAIACKKTKTSLMEQIVHLCLNNMSFVTAIQNINQADERYRVVPVHIDGEVVYLVPRD